MKPIIKIKYNTDYRIKYVENKSDWYDLASNEEIKLKKGDFYLIDLGVAMELPKGYEAHIVPRSSTFKNFGIIQTNGCGIIDNTYNGPTDYWKFPAYATRDIIIHKGDRICQFRLFKNQDDNVFIPSDLEKNTNRDGFGSTGV